MINNKPYNPKPKKKKVEQEDFSNGGQLGELVDVMLDLLGDYSD